MRYGLKTCTDSQIDISFFNNETHPTPFPSYIFWSSMQTTPDNTLVLVLYSTHKDRGLRLNEWSTVEYTVAAGWAGVVLDGRLLVNDTSYRCPGAWKLTLRLSRYAKASIDDIAISHV
jgi:hypothetical protein